MEITKQFLSIYNTFKLILFYENLYKNLLIIKFILTFILKVFNF